MTWHKAADAAELDGKDVVGIEVAGREIAIYRLDGEFFATANICTHQFALMSDGYVEGNCVECPLHQALFDIRTGAVVEGPAEEALRTFPVRVEGTEILVELPD
ncbi:non-heme iron oxygenase ferredoxin subunit [Reyranella sp.]|uniref:non-heme iron oxygenase ferredoxin subunit n=1 Tax=Reyranella sp. TaxID=1929291 RepID=UPI003BAAB34E